MLSFNQFLLQEEKKPHKGLKSLGASLAATAMLGGSVLKAGMGSDVLKSYGQKTSEEISYIFADPIQKFHIFSKQFIKTHPETKRQYIDLESMSDEEQKKFKKLKEAADTHAKLVATQSAKGTTSSY